MKDETESQKYFKANTSPKEKAEILSLSKKTYIEKKRKIPFPKILLENL